MIRWIVLLGASFETLGFRSVCVDFWCWRKTELRWRSVTKKSCSVMIFSGIWDLARRCFWKNDWSWLMNMLPSKVDSSEDLSSVSSSKINIFRQTRITCWKPLFPSNSNYWSYKGLFTQRSRGPQALDVVGGPFALLEKSWHIFAGSSVSSVSEKSARDLGFDVYPLVFNGLLCKLTIGK